MIRVWIETTSRVSRAGLRALLEHAGGVEIVNDAADADVILRDDPGAGHPVSSLPVIALSDEPLTIRQFQDGVRAVLPHDAEPAQILAAIQAAAAGLVAVPAEAAPVLASPEPAFADTEPLTARELEVLEMLAEGLSNKQIAGRLAISEHTAKFHVNSILGKLRAGTRTEAVTRAIRTGILKV